MQSQQKPIFDSSSLQQKIYLTIFKLTKLRCCQTFLQPVDPNIFHGYYQIIIKPICLKEIIRKLKSSQYRYMQDIYEDLLLISKNCFLYHRGKPNQEQVKKIISRYIRSMDNAWLGLKKQMKAAGIDEYKRINDSEIQKKIQNIQQKIKKTILKRMERIKQLGSSQNQQHKIQSTKKNQLLQIKDVVLQKQLTNKQQQIDDKKITKINQQQCISILKDKLAVDQKSDGTLLKKEVISQRSRSSRLSSQIDEEIIIQRKQEQINLTSTNQKFSKIRRSCRLDNNIKNNKSEQKEKEIGKLRQKSQRINNIRKQSAREQTQSQKHILSYKKLRQQSDHNNQSNKNQQQKAQTIILPVSIRKNKQKQGDRDKSKQKINKLSKRKSNKCQNNSQDEQVDRKQNKSLQKQTILNTKNIQHESCTQTIVQIVTNIQIYRPTIIIKAEPRQEHQQWIRQKLQNVNQQQKSPSQKDFQNFNDKEEQNQPIQDYQQQELQNSQQIEQKMNKIIKHKLRKYKTLLINFMTWIYDKIIKIESTNKCHQANVRNKINAQKQIQQTENQCKYCQQCQSYKQQCKMYEKLKNMQSYKYLQQFLINQLQNLQKGQINLKKLLKMLKQYNLWIKLVSGPYIQWRIKQNYLEIQRNIIKCLQKIIQYKKLGPQFIKIVQQTKRQNLKQTYQSNQRQNHRITRSKIKTSNLINYKELFASCQEIKHKQIKQLNLANKYNIYTLKDNNNLKDNKNSDHKQSLGDVQDNYKNAKDHGEFMRLLELDQIYNSFKIVIQKDKNVNDTSKLKTFDKKQQIKKRRIRRNPIQKQKHISQQNSFNGLQQQQQYTPPKHKLNTPKTPRIRKLNKIQQQYQQQQQNRARMEQRIEQDEQFLFQYSLRSNQAILCKYQSRLQLNWNKKMDLLFGAVPQAIKFDDQSTGLENKEQIFI